MGKTWGKEIWDKKSRNQCGLAVSGGVVSLIFRRKGYIENMRLIQNEVSGFLIGKKAEESIRFVEKLKQNIDLPVELWDERLSTVESEQVLIKASVSRKKRKTIVDKLAAQLILQGYLDRMNSQ